MNIFSPVPDLEDFLLIPLALTLLAFHVNVREKMHLHLDLSVAFAFFAAAAFHVERKISRPQAQTFRLLRGREKPANDVKGLDISDGVGARGAAYG